MEWSGGKANEGRNAGSKEGGYGRTKEIEGKGKRKGG